MNKQEDERAKNLKEELEIAATAGKQPRETINAKNLADALDRVLQIFADIAEQMTAQLNAYREMTRTVEKACKQPEFTDGDACGLIDVPADIIEDLPLLRTGLKPMIHRNIIGDLPPTLSPASQATINEAIRRNSEESRRKLHARYRSGDRS